METIIYILCAVSFCCALGLLMAIRIINEYDERLEHEVKYSEKLKTLLDESEKKIVEQDNQNFKLAEVINLLAKEIKNGK